MAKKNGEQSEAERGENIVTMTTTRTAMGDMDTISVAPAGEVEVDPGEQEGDPVQVSDKVAAREQDTERADKNLSDDVGQKKKKFKETRDGRIAGLTREVNDERREKERLKAELEELRQTSTQKETEAARRTKLADAAAVEHYADALSAKMSLAERAHKDAMDAGDTEKASKASKEMAEIAAKQAQVSAWKAANPQTQNSDEGGTRAAPTEEAKNAGSRQTESQNKTPPQKVTYQPETARWIKENPWFDETTDQFNKGMREEAQAFAQLLEARLRRVGNAQAIGSADYFDLIDKHMAENFPEAYGEEEGEMEDQGNGAGKPPPKQQAGGLPNMRGGNGVAAARSSATGRQADPPPQNPNSIRLNEEQRSVAHSLILKHPNGVSYTNREKEIAYARGLKQTSKGA